MNLSNEKWRIGKAEIGEANRKRGRNWRGQWEERKGHGAPIGVKEKRRKKKKAVS